MLNPEPALHLTRSPVEAVKTYPQRDPIQFCITLFMRTLVPIVSQLSNGF